MSSRSAWIRHGLLATAASVLTQPALAQTLLPHRQKHPSKQQRPGIGRAARHAGQFERGRRNHRHRHQPRRAAFDTPLAVTTPGRRAAGAAQLEQPGRHPQHRADDQGRSAAAARSRPTSSFEGLPSGGQYQFTPLMYDGIPVLSTFGLNSSAYRRLLPQRPRHRSARVRARRRFQPVRARLGRRPHQLHHQDRRRQRCTASVSWSGRRKAAYRGDLALTGPLEATCSTPSRATTGRRGPIETEPRHQGLPAPRQPQVPFPGRQRLGDPLRSVHRRPGPILSAGAAERRRPQPRERKRRARGLFGPAQPDLGTRLQYAGRSLRPATSPKASKTKGGQIALAFDKTSATAGA